MGDTKEIEPKEELEPKDVAQILGWSLAKVWRKYSEGTLEGRPDGGGRFRRRAVIYRYSVQKFMPTRN